MDGFYNGTFNFDNSSITGQGGELTKVLSGVFNFVKPGFPNTSYAYDLSGGQVNFLDGKFRGLSVGGQASSINGSRSIGWSIFPMSPYGGTSLVGDVPMHGGRTYTFFFGKVAYSEPAEIGTVPVPEPTTIVGTAFAFASLVQLKRKRKNLSGTS